MVFRIYKDYSQRLQQIIAPVSTNPNDSVYIHNIDNIGVSNKISKNIKYTFVSKATNNTVFLPDVDEGDIGLEINVINNLSDGNGTLNIKTLGGDPFLNLSRVTETALDFGTISKFIVLKIDNVVGWQIV